MTCCHTTVTCVGVIWKAIALRLASLTLWPLWGVLTHAWHIPYWSAYSTHILVLIVNHMSFLLQDFCENMSVSRISVECLSNHESVIAKIIFVLLSWYNIFLPSCNRKRTSTFEICWGITGKEPGLKTKIQPSDKIHLMCVCAFLFICYIIYWIYFLKLHINS